MKIGMGRTLTKRESILVKIAVLILIFTAHYLYIIQPLLIRNAKARGELGLIETEASFLNTWTEKEAELDNKIAELENSLTKMKQLLPSNTGLELALLDLKKIGDTNGIEINTVRQGLAEEKENYRQLPLELTLQGDYYGIKGFMEQLKDLPWLCLISQFDIKNNDSEYFLTNNIRIVVILDKELTEGTEVDVKILPTLKINPFE